VEISLSEQDVTLKDVEDAARVLEGVTRRTPLDTSRTLGELSGMDLYLKMENLQRTGSFKLRGAYNKIYSLSDSERRRGVVAASAGNHAQGTAHAATLLDTRSTIVMPESASPAKIDATKGYGARVILHGSSVDETLEMAKKISAKEGSTFVHPFDDPKVIAGQGTVALEMLDAQPELSVLIVPVGGGGLIAGMSVAAKATSPKVRVVGVQSQAFPGMYMAFKTARIVPFKSEETIADGIAVKHPGKLDYRLIRRLVDDFVLVSDRDIEEAEFLMLERMKTVAEPAGAAGVAACLAGLVKAKGEKCGVVVSGGNIDMYILDQLVAKGLERGHRLLRVRITLSDRPGGLRDVLAVVAQTRANVISVQHERMGRDVPVGRTEVTLNLGTQNLEHTKSLISALGKARLKYKLVN
jgi:threonine dehydratase